MPLTLIEAMAAGCAVVGSQVPGVQEVIVEDSNGLTHRHQDAEHLADQLERLVKDDSLCDRLALSAQSRRPIALHANSDEPTLSQSI